MAYKLTDRAAEDFADIYDYTLLEFGADQADRYTVALESFIETLAGMPGMGRGYPTIPGIMRVEFQQHTLFDKLREDHILIARILHQQMDHKVHLLF